MRGSKVCPKCQKSVGPRLRVCECGHEFAFKIKESVSPSTLKMATSANRTFIGKQSESPVKSSMTNIVLTPAGPVPVKFNGDWTEWVRAVKKYGEESGKLYAPSVYTYWASMYLLDRFSQKGKETLAEIKEIAERETPVRENHE